MAHIAIMALAVAKAQVLVAGKITFLKDMLSGRSHLLDTA
jgi:hypothetical protein